MKRLVDVFVLIAIVASFAVSLTMLYRFVGPTSPWFALTVMFCVLGVTFVARPVFLLRLPPALRRIGAWETKGDVYRRLAVTAFGKLLRDTPLRYLNRHVYLDRNRKDPGAVRFELEAAEAAHFWAALVVFPYIGYALVRGWWSVVAWFAVLQVAFNLYPIFHLRSTRGRIERLLAERRARLWR